MKHLIAALIIITTACPPASAQTTTLVPENASFTIVLNASKVMQSQLGRTILNRIRVEEPRIDEVIDELSEMVGLDLRSSVGQTILFGTGYEHSDFALVADIGSTSGNINGLLLAAPGYESQVYRDKLIVHSLPFENATGESDRIYCALPKRPGTGSYYLVVSFDPQRTRHMIDQTLDADARLVSTDVDQQTLIEVRFKDLPTLAKAAMAEGPPSVVADLIQRAHLSVNESGDSVAGELTLTIVDSLRANQVFELLRGGQAMLQLAATAEPEAQPLADLGAMLRIHHTPQDTAVTVRFDCSYDKLEQLLKTIDDIHQQE